MQSLKRAGKIILLVAAIVTSFTACELLGLVTEVFVSALYSASGTIVNSRTAEGLPAGVPNVAVTLTAIAATEDGTTPTYNTVTNSAGAFTITDMEPGTYEVEAVLDGWFIPPATVSVSGLVVDLDPLPAFKLDPNDAYGLSFILAWNDNVNDLDLHLNFPTSWDDGSMATPYDAVDLTGRGVEIYWNNKTYAGSFPYDVAYQDRDDTDGNGPETTTLVQIPHSDNTVSGTTTVSSSNDVNGLYAAFGSDALTETFRWMGSASVYVNAYTSGAYISSGQTTSADAVVYAIQTLPKDPDNFYFDSLSLYDETDMTANLLGIYRMPDFTKIESAKVLRINMFRDGDNVEWFQLVPDIRVIPEGPAFNTDSSSATFMSVGESLPMIVGAKGIAR